MEAYLKTDALAVGYDGKALISEVALSVQRGRIVTLIGPNGSGKSTILKTIVGQLPVIGGKVFLDGVLRGIDEKLSMHDFRVVDGERQINLIFDVVVPFSYDDEGKRRLLMTIYDDLKAIDQRFNPVVTLDHAM